MSVHTGHHLLAENVAEGIRRHRAGDAAALGELFREVRPWLWRIAMACGLSTHSAEDVVQSTMVSAIIHLPALRDPDAGLAWLSVIARREAVRVSREERRTDLLGDRDLDACVDRADPERVAQGRLARAVLLRAMARLPERYRTLLALMFLDGLSDYATIADELDMPVGSIGPSRQRGLRRVKAILVADQDWDVELAS